MFAQILFVLHMLNHHLQGLSLLARSALIHEASSRIMNTSVFFVSFFLLLEQIIGLLKALSLGRQVSFLQTGCLPWLTSPVYQLRNPENGPLPGATHRVSGTWSSCKAGLPLPVVGLSLMRIPTCHISHA
jgi:hypothetical protein